MLREMGCRVLARHPAQFASQRNASNRTKRMLAAAIATGVVLLGSADSFAASLIWDANTSTTGPQDGSGTWDTTTANWWNPTTSADQVLGATDSAVFGMNASLSAAYTVALGANVTATNLTFNNSGSNAYTVGASGGTDTLTLGGAGGTGGSVVTNLTSSAINVINAPIINSGGISFVGTSPTANSNLQIGSANPGLTGSVTIGDGTDFMRVYAPNAATLSSASSVTVNPFATLEVNGAGSYSIPNLTLTNSGPASPGGTGMGGRGQILFALNGENVTSNITLTGPSAGGISRILGIFYQTISGNIGESGVSSGIEYEENTVGTYLTMIKGTNTYTGTTLINAAAASVNNIVSVSSDASFGADPSTPTTDIVFANTGTDSTDATYLRFDGSFTLNADRNIDLTGHVGSTAIAFPSSTTPSTVAGGTLHSYVQTFDTNGHNVTIGGLIIGSTADAAIAEAVAKNGAGTLTFAQASSYAGITNINAGTLASTVTATPAGTGTTGTGMLNLSGGTLSIAPTGSGANVSLTGVSASATTSVFRFGPGATLALNKGANTSLTYTMGNSATTLGVFSRSGLLGNTLIIAPASGTAALGTSTGERYLVYGTTPVLVNGIQRAAVFGQDTDANQSGDFLTYDSNTSDPAYGFIRATYSSSVDINGGGTAFADTRIFNASSSTNSTLSAGTSVYALRDNGQNITGPYTLDVGVDDSTGNIYSNIIMNGGSITTSTLAFGVTPAAIYTSAANASISSIITDTKGIAFTGPGTMTLSGASTYTGGTFINNTNLSISATGNIGGSTSGSVTFTGGTLTTTAGLTIANAIALNQMGQNIVGGAIDVPSGLTTTLSGVISGAGNLTKLDSGTLVLTGTNTYTGQLVINNGIVSVATIGNSGTASNTGAGITPFALATLNGGTLQFTGSASGTSNRFISLGTNGGTLDASGTVALKLNGPALDYSTQSGARTLTLTGTSAISLQNTFGMSIGDNGGSTSLVKSGTNEWLLSAPSTYTGSTSVLGGTLGLAAGGSFPSGTALTVDSANSATLDLSGFGLSVASLNNGPNGGGTITDSATATTPIFTAASGTFSGVIQNGAGTVALSVQAGAAPLTLGGSNTYTGNTNVYGGTLTIAPTGSIASANVYVAAAASLQANGTTNAGLSTSTALNINGTTLIGANVGTTGITAVTLASATVGSGGLLSIADPGVGNNANRKVLVTGALSLAGTTGAWTGKVDLAANDLIVHSGSLADLTDQARQGFNGGTWNNSIGGLVSTTAAADTTHLTALGVIQNTPDGSSTLKTSFDGVTGLSASDVLVKYTYYGDANLDGKVDASDYSLIDNGYITGATGWYNGDFNYDGVINGSDYTLIDNAFNTQGAQLSAEVASPTAEIAGSSAVPEPTTLCMLGIAAVGVLGRRRRCH